MLLHHAPRRSKKIVGSRGWGFAWGQQCDFFAQRSCASKIAPADRRKKIALAGHTEKLRGGGGAKKSPIAADVFPRGVGEEQKNRVGEPSRKKQRRRSKKIAPGEIASVASNHAIV